jgi:peptidyl-dipeptidase Dcp
MSNPLLQPFDTPFQTPPFSAIQLEHFKPAFEQGIEKAQQEIKAITNSKETPTFENTIAALDFAGKALSTTSSIFFNLNSAETSDEMQALAQEVSPLLTKHSNDILLNEALFKRVKEVFDSKPTHLNPEQETLLEKTYKGFARNGALLNDGDKEKLRTIDERLAILSLNFGQNVLKESNAFELVLDQEEDLNGMPEGIKDAAAETAKQRGYEGKWVFTLDYPSYIPFMTYCENRELRKQMYLAFGSKAYKDNEQNNTEPIKELVKLRLERANLLGYDSHADYVLEERMAKSASAVMNFLDELEVKAMPFAQKEFATLQNFAQELDGIERLEKWDASFYTEKLKKQELDLDDELLRPYFQLEKVVEGVFETAERLYRIRFNINKEIDVYHPDVTAYEVTDTSGKHIAVFYADFFPRPGKRQGAWMTSYRSQYKNGDEEVRPLVSIVCNFTKPTSKKPSLLTFNEVTTLFHEFGHALHGMLANGTYASLSGTSVYWDFVELPSQIMENWCYEKECLDMFAKHYESGDPIPEEYIERIKKSANFMSGMATIRQLMFGELDMAWHSIKKTQAVDNINVKDFESGVINKLDLYPPVQEACTSTQFSHIFQGGYSSGYYSYKWAEVLDADAFEAFKEEGVFNTETAKRFKDHILSAGGSEHPSILYKRFRGKEATVDALLKRSGLIA